MESTGRPFYTRLIPTGLAQVPGLGQALTAGAEVVDTACGGGAGVVRLATTYPACTVTGVDGDAYSIERARRAVAEQVWAALRPGGWFVISNFPFPDTDAGLRTVPGRLMSGIQFFEAQIDDQLLPRTTYDDLLTRHGFIDQGFVELTPVHALTYGRRPVEG